MSLLRSIVGVALLTVFCPVYGQDYDPYTGGPHGVVRVRLNATVYSGLPVHMSAWGPAEAGVYPIIYFFSGFQSTTPVEIYSDVLERIVTHGYVVAAPWNLTTNTDPEDKVDEMQDIFDWTYDNLDSLLIEAGADSGMATDYATAFGMSHSSGAHLLCSYLQLLGCGEFKGLVLTSPVDGVDPNGQEDNFCTTVGETLNFSVPTVVMAAGLDPVPGREALDVSCAPDDLSNRRFYNALDPDSPRWFLNATDFGHMDYTNFGAENFNELVDFCASNEEATVLEINNYQNYISGTAVSFLFGLLEEDCETYLPFLQDTSLMPVNVLGEYIDPSEAEGVCPRGYCSPVPPAP